MRTYLSINPAPSFTSFEICKYRHVAVEHYVCTVRSFRAVGKTFQNYVRVTIEISEFELSV